MNCSKQELIVVAYIGAAAVQSSENRTMQSIQKEMGQLYPGGKIFCQSRVAEVLEQTLEKESYVVHNVLPRGKLTKHDYVITDMPRHVNKIKKMLSVKSIRDTFSFDRQRVKLFEINNL